MIFPRFVNACEGGPALREREGSTAFMPRGPWKWYYICIYMYIWMYTIQCFFHTAMEHGPLIVDLAMNMVISHSNEHGDFP